MIWWFIAPFAAGLCVGIGFHLGHGIGRSKGEVHGVLDERCRWLRAAEKAHLVASDKQEVSFWRILVKQVRLGGWDK